MAPYTEVTCSYLSDPVGSAFIYNGTLGFMNVTSRRGVLYLLTLRGMFWGQKAACHLSILFLVTPTTSFVQRPNGVLMITSIQNIVFQRYLAFKG